MPVCPSGHDSEWTDFCSVCGVSMAAEATAVGSGVAAPAGGGSASPGRSSPGPASPGTASGGAASRSSDPAGAGAAPGNVPADVCPNCHYPRDPGGTFCESCGYDFGSGQLPAAPTVAPAAPTVAPAASASGNGGRSDAVPPAPGENAPSPAATPAAITADDSSATPKPTAAPKPTPTATATTPGSGSDAQPPVPSKAWWVTVDADRAYYDRFSAGGPVPFPDQPPPSQSIPLLGATAAIGRRSRSRGTSPDIDLSGPPEDPAVSHAHASLIRRADGSFSLVDAGSTNGTRVNDEEDAIPVNAPRHLASGDRIYVGAWSRITIEQR